MRLDQKQGHRKPCRLLTVFILIKNLLDGFERFLSRKHQLIAEVFKKVFSSVKGSAKNTKPPGAAKTLELEQKAVRTAARQQLFRMVKELHQAGTPILAIARRLKMSRNTIKKFLASKSELRQPNCPRFSPIRQYLPYLQERWTEEGKRSSRRLWKEIKVLGYQGAEVTLRHFLQKWREAEDAEIKVQTVIKSSAPGRAPSTRQIKWLLLGKQKKPYQQWERLFLQQLCRDVPEIEIGQKLIREFHQLIINRQPEDFRRWVEKARASGIGELLWFVNVEQDYAPVEKAFSSKWSQGQVEGQVNRLKLLKRQMYGRANFDLLRARVVCGS